LCDCLSFEFITVRVKNSRQENSPINGHGVAGLGGQKMTIGASLVLFAVGAVLKFAVTDQTRGGVNLGVVGVILMLVAIVGFLVSLALMTTRRRTDVTYRRDGATYVEPAPTDPRY
jgi:hypothetical protein